MRLCLVILVLSAACGKKSSSSSTSAGSSAGNSGGSNGGSSSGPSESAPAAPTLAAVPADGHVTLSWDAVTGATSYDIARGTAAGAETVLTTVTATTSLDTPLDEGAYFYTVTAKNDVGVSAPSNEVQVHVPSLDKWHERNHADPLRSLAVGNGTTVAVGDASRILTSVDGGVTWVEPALDDTYYLRSVAFGSGVFVAVGYYCLLTSVDGLTWTSHDDFGNLTGVAFGAGHFVAVGGNGQVVTSPDAVTWTKGAVLQVGTSKLAMVGIAYGAGFDGTHVNPNDFFVVTGNLVGEANLYVLYASGPATLQARSDWVGATNDGTGLLGAGVPAAVAFGRIRTGTSSGPVKRAFHIVGRSGLWGYALNNGNDGLAMQPLKTAGAATDDWTGLAFDGTSVMKLFGYATKSCDLLATCFEGTNGWALDAPQPSYSLSAGIYDGGRWVAVGKGELVSAYDTAWHDLHPPKLGGGLSAVGIAAIGQTVVAALEGLYVSRSTDGGLTFTSSEVFTRAFTSIRALNGQFVLTAAQGVATSVDGLVWTAPDLQPADTLQDVAWNGALYVAPADNGAVYTSMDAKSWTRSISTGLSGTVTRIVTDGSAFFGIAGSDIVTSSDGLAWASVHSVSGSFGDINVDHGVIVGVGATQASLSSDHGAHWEDSAIADASHCSGVTYFAGEWMAVCSGGEAIVGLLYTSVDAMTWKERTLQDRVAAAGIGVGAGRVFVFGTSGDIVSTF